MSRVNSCRGIRGACAPASLKPRSAQRLTIQQPLYPGRLRPGLIEALLHPWLSPPRRRLYPGRLRPGLIEAPNSRQAFSTVLKYPGRLRPGLIEARPHANPGFFTTRSYPGRLRPGLIEARSKPAPACPHDQSIRGACAPASLKPSTSDGWIALLTPVSGAPALRHHRQDFPTLRSILPTADGGRLHGSDAAGFSGCGVVPHGGTVT